MPEPNSRTALIAAIMNLLAVVDYRKLRLVWIYASHLSR